MRRISDILIEKNAQRSDNTKVASKTPMQTPDPSEEEKKDTDFKTTGEDVTENNGYFAQANAFEGSQHILKPWRVPAKKTFHKDGEFRDVPVGTVDGWWVIDSENKRKREPKFKEVENTSKWKKLLYNGEEDKEE